jgi:hypothetical protein
MGTIFQDVLTGGGTIAARQAGHAFDAQQRLNQEAGNLRQQGIDYYQRFGTEAATDRNTARQGNQAYGQMALSDREKADYELPNIMAQLAKAYGVSGFGTPRGEASAQAYATPFDRNLVPGPYREDAGGTPYQNMGDYQTGQGRQPSPYDLSPVQQQQSNQAVDRINAQRKTAIANYRAQAAQGGGQPNPAMEEYINSHYDQETNRVTTEAAERARELAAQGASAFLQHFTNQRNIGTAQYGDSLDRQLQIAAQALGQGAGAPFGQYSALTSQDASQMGQLGQYNQQRADQSFGDLVKLAAFAAAGGFGGGMSRPGTPPLVPGAQGPVSSYNPFLNGGNANLFPDTQGY